MVLFLTLVSPGDVKYLMSNVLYLNIIYTENTVSADRYTISDHVEVDRGIGMRSTQSIQKDKFDLKLLNVVAVVLTVSKMRSTGGADCT